MALAFTSLSGCIGGEDRYPDLNLRDFERVQGTFTSASAPTEAVAPASLGAKEMAEVENALLAAGDQHARFLSEANKVRPLITSASGTGIEDNRWPIAQIAIGSLESHNGQTASLLADLDSLYADASLSFKERTQIDLAREQVSDYHAVERQSITELITLLASAPDSSNP
uniref:hypothetical protein n=1 Tax=uncultured Altererythrobacter sp. TaxID=500840 RepID=UPI00260C9D9B|nr:hypothetical protein [uncultured Altererythrobacter sp.]